MEMVLVYGILAVSALFIVRQDICSQTIPLTGLALFIVSAFFKQYWEPDLEGIWAAGAIILTFLSCQGLFYLFKHKPAMGWGDLILSPGCGLWLQIQEIPSFFVASGFFSIVIGLFWRYRWGMRTFPFAPALLLGLGVIFLIRCFFIMNEI